MTVISGNFSRSTCETLSPEPAAELEARLVEYAGKPIGVVVRTAAEMRAVLKANPFPEAEGKYTYAIFLDRSPPRSQSWRKWRRSREHVSKSPSPGCVTSDRRRVG
jgi:uncharacterized protein (DUF1697 family)